MEIALFFCGKNLIINISKASRVKKILIYLCIILKTKSIKK